MSARRSGKIDRAVILAAGMGKRIAGVAGTKVAAILASGPSSAQSVMLNR
jgi:choline kinase